MRILAVADIWQGSDAYAFVRAFRRKGHSVQVLPPENFVPGWRNRGLRGLRRLLAPLLVREYARALVEEGRRFRPHLFFVFKGRYVAPDAVRELRELGAVAINVFPDVSILAHGRYIPEALPQYDWVFTTKTFGLEDMERLVRVHRASFMPPSFDPEVHRPVELDVEDVACYGCDVSFIGTWSPKKQRLLEWVGSRLPEIRLRVWGDQWQPGRRSLAGRVQGRGVIGLEYAKAIVASKINLCVLSEARRGSSSGDRITARTFQIPATGAFLLHERTPELQRYFQEGTECGCFETPEELVEKIRHYLAAHEDRRAVALAGRERALESGYEVDFRAEEILRKVEEIAVVTPLAVRR